MKFYNLLKQKYVDLLEQVPADLNGLPPEAMPGAMPTDLQTPPRIETEKQPLTAEGEVFLVRLLRKALFMNPGDIDEKLLKDLPEINEKNASEVLNSIINIMKKYSNTIDVETKV